MERYIYESESHPHFIRIKKLEVKFIMNQYVIFGLFALLFMVLIKNPWLNGQDEIFFWSLAFGIFSIVSFLLYDVATERV
jgi:hypothetical protein